MDGAGSADLLRRVFILVSFSLSSPHYVQGLAVQFHSAHLHDPVEVVDASPP